MTRAQISVKLALIMFMVILAYLLIIPALIGRALHDLCDFLITEIKFRSAEIDAERIRRHTARQQGETS